jgi:hypothetical protein
MKPNKICKGTTNSKASIQKEGKMKRILVIALLAGVLISTIGVTMAVGEENPTITRAIFGGPPSEAGVSVKVALGIVTLNFQTGEWTLTTYAPLPSTDANLYYAGITLSTPLAGQGGRYANGVSEFVGWINSVDGRIVASGTINDLGLLTEIEILLEGGSVFVLMPNDV